MKVSRKQADIHAPGTVVLELSEAEYAAVSFYARHFAAGDIILAAAHRFDGDTTLWSYSVEFQNKLFR